MSRTEGTRLIIIVRDQKPVGNHNPGSLFKSPAQS